MKKFLGYLSVLILAAACIKNDLPLPVVKGGISSLDIEGAEDVDINQEEGVVKVLLGESVDPSSVRVRSVKYLNPGTSAEPEIVGVLDLSKPFDFTLKTYQEYPWTMVASQRIERHFSVMGQIGAESVDDVNRRVIAYVPSDFDLSDIVVTSLKLGPEDVTTYEPPMTEMKDFNEGIEVNVSYRGHSEKWMLYLEPTELIVFMDSVDPWTGCAWLKASGPVDADNGFRYRLKGEEEWIDCPDVEQDGGVFSVCIDSLAPLTSYECIAFSGEEETAVYEFTTEDALQLPNAGFECFSNAESPTYKSWYDPAAASAELKSKWWDSGNIGSTTVGSAYCIARPDGENKVEGSYSAELISRNVIIKFAAGNTFSGEFADLVGTQGGKINFGRPWSLRPRAVRIWLKYEGGLIDMIDSSPAGVTVKEGDPDFCSVWIALGDWDYRKYNGTPQCPVQVNTTDRSTFFDPDGESVIAYACFEAEGSSKEWADMPEIVSVTDDGWAQVEIPLDYKKVGRKPTHIIISLASSRYGDYFTGSSESRLWADDIVLIY